MKLLAEPEEIRARLLSLIGKREYSRQQLQRRLAAQCADPAELEAALDELQAASIIDDQRYSQSLIAQRLQDGWGYLRIAQDLRQAGVDELTQAGHLAANDDNEFWQQQAFTALQRKYSDLSFIEDKAARAKAIAFLQRRGFSFDHSSRACEQAISDLG